MCFDKLKSVIKILYLTRCALYAKNSFYKTFTKQKMEHGAVKAVFVDLKDALACIVRENPYLSEIIILNTIGSIILTPMISIGLPVFVSTYLGRGESVLGLLQGIIVFGGTLGVIALQLIGEKATVKLVRPIIFISLFILISTGVVFVLSTHDYLRFFYLIGSFFSIIALTTILETIIFAHVGQKTSEFMVGKVMAIMVSFLVLGYAVGDSLYGFLLRRFIDHSNPGYVLIIMAGIGVAVALFTKVEKKSPLQ